MFSILLLSGFVQCCLERIKVGLGLIRLICRFGYTDLFIYHLKIAIILYLCSSFVWQFNWNVFSIVWSDLFYYRDSFLILPNSLHLSFILLFLTFQFFIASRFLSVLSFPIAIRISDFFLIFFIKFINIMIYWLRINL